jgi:hypothetical protein
MSGLATGLSRATAKILEAGGLDTRDKIIAAGEIQWLKLPHFGKTRMEEVNAWLGRDSPATRWKILQAQSFLESHGYSVLDPK